MKSVLLSGVLALGVLAASPVFAQEAEEGEVVKGVQWTEDYAGALATATAEKKRLFIEFTATW
jgi:hypothetical protein